jgi:hypothetical protein
MVIIVVVIIVAFLFFVVGAVTASPVDAGLAARTTIELHRARRRLESGIVRGQMKSDAARLRRELEDEMAGK